MNDKSKAVKWVCLTALVAVGMKYLPPYMLEQRKLDMQDRILDLKEAAFLQQHVTPTVSVPVPAGVHAGSATLL